MSACETVPRTGCERLSETKSRTWFGVKPSVLQRPTRNSSPTTKHRPCSKEYRIELERKVPSLRPHGLRTGLRETLQNSPWATKSRCCRAVGSSPFDADVFKKAKFSISTALALAGMPRKADFGAATGGVQASLLWWAAARALVRTCLRSCKA